MFEQEYKFPVDINDSDGNPTITVYLKDEFRTKGKCKKCGAKIYWAKTRKGKWMPITKQILPDGDYIFESHYSNCPYAKEFRR